MSKNRSAAISLELVGGHCSVGVESTIVRVADDKIEVLRPGGVAAEDLAEATGREVIVIHKSVLPVAPGMMEYHYSPLTPMVLVEEGSCSPMNHEGGYIAFRKIPEKQFRQATVLSPEGDLEQAAAAMFAALHVFDSAGLQ
jgi:L-threonylcarbamoyladenylate synthase